MDRNELFDKFMRHLAEKGTAHPDRFLEDNLEKSGVKPRTDEEYILKTSFNTLIKQSGLVEESSRFGDCRLTELGNTVMDEYGGYTAYVKNNKKRFNTEEYRKAWTVRIAVAAFILAAGTWLKDLIEMILRQL